MDLEHHKEALQHWSDDDDDDDDEDDDSDVDYDYYFGQQSIKVYNIGADYQPFYPQMGEEDGFMWRSQTKSVIVAVGAETRWQFYFFPFKTGLK